MWINIVVIKLIYVLWRFLWGDIVKQCYLCVYHLLVEFLAHWPLSMPHVRRIILVFLFISILGCNSRYQTLLPLLWHCIFNLHSSPLLKINFCYCYGVWVLSIARFYLWATTHYNSLFKVPDDIGILIKISHYLTGLCCRWLMLVLDVYCLMSGNFTGRIILKPSRRVASLNQFGLDLTCERSRFHSKPRLVVYFLFRSRVTINPRLREEPLYDLGQIIMLVGFLHHSLGFHVILVFSGIGPCYCCSSIICLHL